MSDEIIIKACLEGNQQGYAQLIQKYELLAFTLALRIVKDREDAKEVTQDAFLKAFRYLNSFRGECQFSTWLYKIVYSAALNHLRKKKLDLLSLDDENATINLPNATIPTASFETEKKEQTQQIEAAIKLLPPNHATIITLFYLYEQKIEEICITMDINTSNAKTLLSRARQRLKVIMESEFTELKN